MFLAVRLVLLLGVLLYNLENTAGIKIYSEKNEAQLTTQKSKSKQEHSSNLANNLEDQSTENNDYENLDNYETPANFYSEVAHVQPETLASTVFPKAEINNKTDPGVDELPQGFYKSSSLDKNSLTEASTNEEGPNHELNPSVETKPNTSSNLDSFYAKPTSDIPSFFITQKVLDNEKKEAGQRELTPVAEKPVLTSTKDAVNYNKDTLPKCPTGFTHYYLFGVSTCYLITEPTSFPPSCPYPNTINFYNNLPFTNQTFWLLASRNTSDGFGPFEWVKESTFYPVQASLNLKLRHYREEEKSITEKSCLVFNAEGEFIPTSCSDKYPAICIYYYSSYLPHFELPIPTFSSYCKKRYNESCTSNDLSSPLKCYCKSEAQVEKQSRNTFCKKLAEMTTPAANNLSASLLHDNERCWFGLQRNKTLYQWSSANTTSNYTFWSGNVDFTKTYGALASDGWLLEEDGALACAICETEVNDHPQIHLHIKHNKTSNALQVEVRNAIEVFRGVTCFDHNSSNYRTMDLTYNTENYLVLHMEFPFTTTGYYWCVALQTPDLTPVYSNTILVANTDSTYGHEYAVLITFPEHTDPHLTHSDEQACKSIENNLSEIAHNLRPIKIISFNEKEGNVEVVCHLNTNPSELSITKEFGILSNLLKDSSANVSSLASTQVCLPSVTISGSYTLHWPETPMGVTTIPEELCVQKSGIPVTRTCAGSFYYGTRWLYVNGTCADVTHSPRTRLLNQLLRSTEPTASTLSESLLNITKDPDDFTSLEVYLVSKLLEKLASFSERLSVTSIAKTVNNIMHFGRSKLKVAQEILNSTDMILCSLDDMLAATKVDDSGYTSAVTEKLLVQINDLNKTDIIGVKLGTVEAQSGFDPSKINPLHRGISQEDLLKENLDLAILIPQQLQNDLLKCMGPDKSPNLITTVFYDDVLFSEQQNTSNYADGRIIGVTIPGFDCAFTIPLQVIFKPSSDNIAQLKCASWVYGTNERIESIHGRWFVEGDPKTLDNSSYQICEFTHVTHFTLLVLGGSKDISAGHKKALDIITAVGSGLSILGLLGVFLTAVMFKSFRSANVVVVNFSIAMTAQIVLLFIADNVAENKGLCIAFGAALHYIVLAQFFWMLTIAILQYKRYVLVFSSPTTHLVAKTCAFSWGIPLIPVIVIVSISRDNYGENSHGLCYALGNYFIFGVLLPVCIILLVNLLVFLRIMLSVASSRRITVHQQKNDTSSLQLRLAIMLYFLLGLTWGFGLLAAIGAGIVYSYLFCLTATLQGFILFLYFIVLNEKTRSLWINMKTCCKKSDEYDVNADSAATAMVRRPRNTQNSNTNTDSTTSEMLRRYKNRSSSDF